MGRENVRGAFCESNVLVRQAQGVPEIEERSREGPFQGFQSDHLRHRTEFNYQLKFSVGLGYRLRVLFVRFVLLSHKTVHIFR